MLDTGGNIEDSILSCFQSISLTVKGEKAYKPNAIRE